MGTHSDIAVLGAERYIGQFLLTLLDGHPQFRVCQLFASPGAQSGIYGTCVDWLRPEPVPAAMDGIELEALGAPLRAPLCLSVLPDGVAADWDRFYASAGARVITHAEDLRLTEGVPLLVPELSAREIEAGRVTEALIATPNCTSAILALPLSVLDQAFGVEAVCVTALQAITGADLTGPRAISLTDNLIPGLTGEEEALRHEVGRLFSHRFALSTHAVRVPVHTGHCLTVSVGLATSTSPGEVSATLKDYRTPAKVAQAPTGIARPIRIFEESHRPAPRLDAGRDGGMIISVGGVRPCPVFGTAMTIVGDNMMRGSAGSTLLLAELLDLASR